MPVRVPQQDHSKAMLIMYIEGRLFFFCLHYKKCTWNYSEFTETFLRGKENICYRSKAETRYNRRFLFLSPVAPVQSRVHLFQETKNNHVYVSLLAQTSIRTTFFHEKCVCVICVICVICCGLSFPTWAWTGRECRADPASAGTDFNNR